jgi:hypothetical protein
VVEIVDNTYSPCLRLNVFLVEGLLGKESCLKQTREFGNVGHGEGKSERS